MRKLNGKKLIWQEKKEERTEKELRKRRKGKHGIIKKNGGNMSEINEKKYVLVGRVRRKEMDEGDKGAKRRESAKKKCEDIKERGRL